MVALVFRRRRALRRAPQQPNPERPNAALSFATQEGQNELEAILRECTGRELDGTRVGSRGL